MGSYYRPEIVDKAKAMYLRGHTIYDIIKELGIGSYNTVRKWIEDGGWDAIREEITVEKTKEVIESFEKDIETYNKSKINFHLNLYSLLVKAFADYQNNDGEKPIDFNTLKSIKITTEIMANLDNNLSKIVNMNTEGNEFIEDFISKLNPTDEELAELYASGKE
ncbi:MAG: hypothetical protein WC261_13285 [Synergistaceae bacterium]|jgi:transposase-like protein